MSISFIYDQRRDASAVVRFISTRDDNGHAKRKSVTIGTVSACEKYLYNRQEKVENIRRETRNGNPAVADAMDVILGDELNRFQLQVLERSYSFASKFPLSTLELTDEDWHLIRQEVERLERRWRDRLALMIHRGWEQPYDDSQHSFSRTRHVGAEQLVSIIRALGRRGKRIERKLLEEHEKNAGFGG